MSGSASQNRDGARAERVSAQSLTCYRGDAGATPRPSAKRREISGAAAASTFQGRQVNYKLNLSDRSQIELEAKRTRREGDRQIVFLRCLCVLLIGRVQKE